MERKIFMVVAAFMLAVSAKAQIIEETETVDGFLTPDLFENYFESQLLADGGVESLLPEEMQRFSLVPPEFNEAELDIIVDDDENISDTEIEDALKSLQGDMADYARKFLGTRYVWGAKGPKAFDCSGFTGYVFKNFGYDIGPCSRVQATRGKKVDIKDARVGDLMFFTRPKGGRNVGHVGMVIDVNPDDGTLKFIHASSKKGVTIQNFPDSGHYNRRFLQVRRVIDEDNIAAR